MSDTFDLDRAVSIERNIDANGRRWVIHANRQNGLCYARPDPDRSDAHIPEVFKGLWTKASLLQTRIDDYLVKSWDQADAANAAAERKREAAREQKKVAKKSGTKDE